MSLDPYVVKPFVISEGEFCVEAHWRKIVVGNRFTARCDLQYHAVSGTHLLGTLWVHMEFGHPSFAHIQLCGIDSMPVRQSVFELVLAIAMNYFTDMFCRASRSSFDHEVSRAGNDEPPFSGC